MRYNGCGVGLTWTGVSLFSVIHVLTAAGLSLRQLFSLKAIHTQDRKFN